MISNSKGSNVVQQINSKGINKAIEQLLNYNNVFDMETTFEKQKNLHEIDVIGDVVFEVAPGPNNKELSARWNALPCEAQLAISDTVSRSVLPSVLEAAGADGSVSTQIGSYEDDTNPSFSLRLTSGDLAAVANAVGFVLSQDSMVALSSNTFEGSFEAGAVRIQVGNITLQEIDVIYQTLRSIKGFTQISGQSTTDGQMTLILDEKVDAEAFSFAVADALALQYAVLFDSVNVAFPSKETYNYGSVENDPAGESGVARQRYRAIRDQASQEVAAAINQYERRRGQQQQPSAAAAAEEKKPLLKMSSFNFVNYLFTAKLVSMIRSAKKNVCYPSHGPDRRIFKQSRGGRRNPGRSNRHIFTNKDMRFW